MFQTFHVAAAVAAAAAVIAAVVVADSQQQAVATVVLAGPSLCSFPKRKYRSIAGLHNTKQHKAQSTKQRSSDMEEHYSRVLSKFYTWSLIGDDFGAAVDNEVQRLLQVHPSLKPGVCENVCVCVCVCVSLSLSLSLSLCRCL